MRMLLTSANDAPVGISARQIPKNRRLRWISLDGWASAMTPDLRGRVSGYNMRSVGPLVTPVSRKPSAAVEEPNEPLFAFHPHDRLGVVAASRVREHHGPAGGNLRPRVSIDERRKGRRVVGDVAAHLPQVLSGGRELLRAEEPAAEVTQELPMLLFASQFDGSVESD